MRFDISRALDILYHAEHDIPRQYFRDCFGVLFLSATEFGVFVSGTHGSGILMSHNPRTNTWSSPLSVNLQGVGVGLTVGSEQKDVVIFFHSPEMISRFATNVHVQLGSHSMWGKKHNGEEQHHPFTLHATSDGGSFVEGDQTTAFSYSNGRFFGIELEGAILRSNKKRHRDFYGPAISPKRILLGASVRCNQRSGVNTLKQKLVQLTGQARSPEECDSQNKQWMRKAVGAAVSAV